MTNDTQRLDELKQKYQSVLRVIEEQNVSLSHVDLQDGKLFIEGAAHSEEAKNKVWDQIKRVNPNWESELICDIRTEAVQMVGSNTGQTSVNNAQSFSTRQAGPDRTYTVRPGDSLSTISRQFFGNTQDYKRIFEANKDKLSDPDNIQPGQVLTIPA